MYRNAIIRIVLILTALFLITYSLADGINNGNALAISLALASLVALGVCIHLFTRLLQTREEEEVEEV